MADQQCTAAANARSKSNCARVLWSSDRSAATATLGRWCKSRWL